MGEQVSSFAPCPAYQENYNYLRVMRANGKPVKQFLVLFIRLSISFYPAISVKWLDDNGTNVSGVVHGLPGANSICAHTQGHKRTTAHHASE